MTRTCPICGGDFEPRTSQQRYCSKECKTEHDRQWHRDYYETHKERFRDYYAKHKERYRENRRRWGEIRGENQGSWCSTERTELYAKQAIAALDDDERWGLAMLLGSNGGYSRRMIADWTSQCLRNVLREIERREQS